MIFNHQFGTVLVVSVLQKVFEVGDDGCEYVAACVLSFSVPSL